MAITNNGTKNSLPAGLIPSGYTKPTVSEFSDYEYVRTLELSVLKSTVENASHATTMANIISNGAVGITKQISDILAADILASATTTAWADWIALSTNFKQNATGDLLSNVACSYVCTVKLYVKIQ